MPSKEVSRRAIDRLFPEQDPLMYNPTEWVEQRCRRWLWSVQKEILESVRDNRFTYVPSCHGPGKSFTASCAAAWWIDTHPPGQAFVLSTAPSDSQVKSILWREISRRHEEAGMTENSRITLDAHWYAKLGGRDELIGIGRKPQDYKQELFQGIHAKYVLILVDEACGVPKQLFDALETLMTNDYARMLAIGNPDDPISYFEQLCRPGSGGNVIRIPAYRTPNFSGEWVPRDVAEQLVTPLWVAERAKKWGKTSPLYISKVDALFPEISSDTLITPQMVRIAQEETQLAGLDLGSYGFDVARLGGDETTLYRNRGGRIRMAYRAHLQTTDITTDAITHHLIQHGENYVPCYVDVIGLGAAVFDELKARDLNVVPINVSEPAYDPKRFANRRAELFWKWREGFEKKLIDISPEDEDLAAQATSIKWGLTRKKGQIYIESKDEMRRRGLPSPDRADGAMLSYAPAVGLAPITQIVVGKTVAGDLLHLNM